MMRHFHSHVPRHASLCVFLSIWEQLWPLALLHKAWRIKEEGTERWIWGLMNRVVLIKVSWQKRRGMRSLTPYSPVASSPHTQRQSQSLFHQQEQHFSLFLSHKPLFFVQLCSGWTLLHFQKASYYFFETSSFLSNLCLITPNSDLSGSQIAITVAYPITGQLFFPPSLL